jgi:hypothetical protein
MRNKMLNTKKYKKLVNEKLPYLNFLEIPHLNRIKMLEIVAMEYFIRDLPNDKLSNITRTCLTSLKTKGYF